MTPFERIGIAHEGNSSALLEYRRVYLTTSVFATQPQAILTGDQPLPTQPEFDVSLLMAYQCAEEEALAEAHEHDVAHSG